MTETSEVHIIDVEPDTRWAVEIFSDGSVHIYDDDAPTEEQVSLLASEVDALFSILQKTRGRK
jgi:hypothetical protein